ncbi:Outer membrane efflux protein [Elusimicrobium minutum Pei191]|uniref:Outer membrane efflux protein n=1 Tax=Elusimicrobium minutum (strain Pei191) TaxID=445932 RepID=B2KDI4_ELUMP|nr:TolC family protein [Elusimicrobium minutum]ACC98580.1 Outer membrane efflux protein [Elusimicrobium minutum Pei191]
MKIIKQCGAAVFILTAVFSYAKDYTFENALNRTLAIDENILAVQKDVYRAAAENRAAAGLYFPKIGVQGKYTRINDPIGIDLNSIRDAIQPLYPPSVILPDFYTQVQDDNFFKAQAVASMPVFTGGKIRAANIAAKSSLEEAVAKLDGARDNVLVDVSTKYFRAMLAKKVVKVRREYMNSTREHADNSAKMFKAGTIAKVEKMSADLSYTQARRDFNSSLNDRELASVMLQSLLSESEPVNTVSDLFVCHKEDVDTLEYFKKLAFQNHYSLRILNSKKKAADANIKAQKSTFMPSVYLFGTRELHEHDLTILEPEYAYGVGFEWNIFEGFGGYNRSKAAKRQREMVDFLKEKQLKDIDTYVEHFHKKMLNAVYNYEAVREEIKFAKEFLRMRTLAYKAGTGTSLEVNMARTQLLKAELDSLSASYDFVVSLSNLLSLTGRTQDFAKYQGKCL